MKPIFLRNKNSFQAERRLPSLGFCILFDLAGYATYSLPFFGEFLDLLWAPLSAIIFWKMFGFRKGFVGGVFSFVEELTPGLDFIPTFTINWLLVFLSRNKTSFRFGTTMR